MSDIRINGDWLPLDPSEDTASGIVDISLIRISYNKIENVYNHFYYRLRKRHPHQRRLATFGPVGGQQRSGSGAISGNSGLVWLKRMRGSHVSRRSDVCRLLADAALHVSIFLTTCFVRKLYGDSNAYVISLANLTWESIRIRKGVWIAPVRNHYTCFYRHYLRKTGICPSYSLNNHNPNGIDSYVPNGSEMVQRRYEIWFNFAYYTNPPLMFSSRCLVGLEWDGYATLLNSFLFSPGAPLAWNGTAVPVSLWPPKRIK